MGKVIGALLMAFGVGIASVFGREAGQWLIDAGKEMLTNANS